MSLINQMLKDLNEQRKKKQQQENNAVRGQTSSDSAPTNTAMPSNIANPSPESAEAPVSPIVDETTPPSQTQSAETSLSPRGGQQPRSHSLCL